MSRGVLCVNNHVWSCSIISRLTQVELLFSADGAKRPYEAYGRGPRPFSLRTSPSDLPSPSVLSFLSVLPSSFDRTSPVRKYPSALPSFSFLLSLSIDEIGSLEIKLSPLVQFVIEI